MKRYGKEERVLGSGVRSLEKPAVSAQKHEVYFRVD